LYLKKRFVGRNWFIKSTPARQKAAGQRPGVGPQEGAAGGGGGGGRGARRERRPEVVLEKFEAPRTRHSLQPTRGYQGKHFSLFSVRSSALNWTRTPPPK
jgi:hypothetical protein